MSDWLHNLPVLWMALVVFGATYLTSAIIYSIVMFRSGRAGACIQGRLPRYVAAAGYSFRSLRRLYRRLDLERHRSS